MATQTETGWLPIATAPKDGTKVMLYRPGWGIGVVGQWGDPNSNDDDIPFGWCLEDDVYAPGALSEGFIGWNEESDIMPTHWIPLPPEDKSP